MRWSPADTQWRSGKLGHRCIEPLCRRCASACSARFLQRSPRSPFAHSYPRARPAHPKPPTRPLFRKATVVCRSLAASAPKTDALSADMGNVVAALWHAVSVGEDHVHAFERRSMSSCRESSDSDSSAICQALVARTVRSDRARSDATMECQCEAKHVAACDGNSEGAEMQAAQNPVAVHGARERRGLTQPPALAFVCSARFDHSDTTSSDCCSGPCHTAGFACR